MFSHANDVLCNDILSNNNVLTNIKCVALLSSVMIQDSKGNISFPNSFHPHHLSFKFTQNITTIIKD